MSDLVLFDLDGTLLSGDSDFEWGNFMCEVGAVNKKDFQRDNQYFYEQYLSGNLDIHKYLSFALQPFSQHPIEKMLVWRAKFIESTIKPMINDEDKALVMRHKTAGDTTLIITATNRFITQPIAELFAVDDLIATELEMRNEKYTGLPTGVPCYKDGKVECLRLWLTQNNVVYEKIWFYSDSINDLPLLEYVDQPVIKNGDTNLIQIAKQRDWQIV